MISSLDLRKGFVIQWTIAVLNYLHGHEASDATNQAICMSLAY